jgi:tetratricopeptide (TPR) repeat protein
VKWIFCFCVFCSGLVFLGLPIQAQPDARNPYGDYFGVYREFISGIRGGTCPMYPSCSHYGEAVLRQRGVLGAPLVADRLLRCGHEAGLYAPTTLGYFQPLAMLDVEPGRSTIGLVAQPARREAAYRRPGRGRQADSSALGKQLMALGLYQEALSEFLRWRQANRKDDIEVEASILKCLIALGKDETGLAYIREQMPAIVARQPDVRFLLGRMLLNVASNDSAAAVFEAVGRDTLATVVVGEQARLMAGKAYVLGRQYAMARLVYAKIPDRSPYAPHAQSNLALTERAASFPKKSKRLAGFLGIVPGLGYLYSGHRQTALSALLINGLLGYATWNTLAQGNYGLGSLLGVFTAAFYTGNIIGSVKAAERWNEAKHEAIAAQLRVFY